MTNQNPTATFEVQISLSDFFDDNRDRSEVLQTALSNAIFQRLGDNQWVQSNIAHYLFKRLTTETFESQITEIKDAVKKAIDEHKTPDKWRVEHHPVYEVAISDALHGIKDEIRESTTKLARKFLADESDSYSSFYGRVADACVDKVFTHFVDAMVTKEESKR